MYTRKETIKVKVGNLTIGGNDNIIIQSMTTTKTKNVKETVEQIKKLTTAGCQIVRVAVLDIEDAKAIKDIKKQISIPIVADIHFNYKYALESINSGVDKIRINPGNIGSEENIKTVVDACKEKNIPIRIGVNAGSLEKHILEKYAHPTAEGMVDSAKYHVELLEKHNFKNIIISLKSSDTLMTIKAYELAAQIFPYPLHLGVTEAGTIFSGSIKNSIGIGILLYKGIGNTIRVSISADPVEEIKVAKEILKNFNLYTGPTLVSCPTCGRIQYNLIKVAKEIEDFLLQFNSPIKVAVMGCAVNGPGEAREADIGIAGGQGEGLLFKHGEIIKKVPENEMVETLKEEIIKMIKRK